MGTSKIKQKIFTYKGFSVGDRVSHSKVGSNIGKIIFFAEFYDSTYALIDYGKRKRFERVKDLLPLRNDIYSHNTRGENSGTR